MMKKAKKVIVSSIWCAVAALAVLYEQEWAGNLIAFASWLMCALSLMVASIVGSNLSQEDIDHNFLERLVHNAEGSTVLSRTITAGTAMLLAAGGFFVTATVYTIGAITLYLAIKAASKYLEDQDEEEEPLESEATATAQ